MKTPTPLSDGLSIFCNQMRYKEKMKLEAIAEIANIDHSTVSYHLRMYGKKSKRMEFREFEKDFRMDDFKEQYSKFRTIKSSIEKNRLTRSILNTNTGSKTKEK